MQPNSQYLNQDGTLNYEALGVEPPKHFEHGNDTDIRQNMELAKPTRWFQRGNELVAETPLGELVNMIPTDLMMTGIDENGLPILTKLEL